MSDPILVREWRAVSLPDGDVDVFVVAPAGGERRPTILMLQEIFGVNAAMQACAALFASRGYAVAVPDIFFRQARRTDLAYAPEDRQAGFRLMQAYDLEQGVEDLMAVVKGITAWTDAGPPLSIVGFCLGGKLAVRLGARVDAAAVVSFYGVRLDEDLEQIAKIHGPLQLHIGDADEHIPPDTRATLSAALAKQSTAEFYLYAGARHGFFNAARDDVYDRVSAELAFARALAVLPSPPC